MRPEPPPPHIAWILAALWGGMPLYPSFIALLPVTPPGLSLIGPLPALGILACVGVMTVLLAVELRRRGGTALLRDRFTLALGVYLASMAIPSVLGFVPVVGAVFCLITACCIVGTTAVRFFGADPRTARFMAWSLILSNGLASVLALTCLVLRTPAALYAISNGRAVGTFVVPGELAGYLGMLLPFTVGAALTGRTVALRVVAGSVALIDAVTAVATFSRAGLFGLAIALFAAAALLLPRLLPWLALAALAAATQLRHVVNLHHNPAENFNRLSIWIAALRAVQLFPLWGTGPGGFTRIYPFVKLPSGEPLAFHAHNFFLTTWAETGIIGLCGLIYLWTVFFLMFRARYRAAGAKARIVGVAVLAGFIATILQSMVDVVQILFLGLWIPFMGMAFVALENGSA